MSLRRAIRSLSPTILALACAATSQAGGLSFVEYEAVPGLINHGLRDVEELAVSPDGENVPTSMRRTPPRIPS